MVVVNDPKNLPPKILYIKMKKTTALFTMILNSFSAEGKKCGVKRNNYYLFTVDAVYIRKYKEEENAKEFNVFMNLINHAARIYYTYIMFVV
jgi:hypothetical protein